MGNLRLRGTLTTYLKWPLLLSPLLIIMNLHLYLTDKRSGWIMSCYLVVYLLLALILHFHKRSILLRDLVNYAMDFGHVQKELLAQMDLPFGLLDEKGHVLWANHALRSILGGKGATGKSIGKFFPELTPQSLPSGEATRELHFERDDESYMAVMRLIHLDSFERTGTEAELSILEGSNTLITLYLYNETEMLANVRETKEQSLIVGLLYIDNYDESLESVDEVRRSLLAALVDRKINKYMSGVDAIVKKLEKDKYIFLFRHKYTPWLKEDRFSLLDDVRTINVGNEIAITISMGLGMNAESFNKRYEYARTAIDLALGRGGDQVVIKDADAISYFGGKSIQMEKNTRVKARVKAHALRELMEAANHVVVMGHSIGDVDSFGASIGIYRIAKSLGKTTSIVMNEVTSSIRPLLNRFLENADYEEGMFVTGEKAKGLVDNQTLLVVADVNKPRYTECPELLSQTKTIVILDHHRQTEEAIANPLLSYIEPYASSACEMAAEILQYIGDGIRLKPLEADSMYAGIMIDTNNFVNSTGVRTFEAVAYLRRCGADVTRIRKMFRTSIQEFILQAEAIQHTELYMDSFAISICTRENVESPTIIGAKVANSLLEVVGVTASFVLTKYHNKIYISARSIDEVNVQIVMEKFGGGGHISVAGAQMEHVSMEDAVQTLKQTLRTMKDDGEI